MYVQKECLLLKKFIIDTKYVLDNFKKLQLINKEKIKNKKYYSSDKGFNNESIAFLKACKENINSIDAETLFANSEITFKIIEKLREI